MEFVAKRLGKALLTGTTVGTSDIVYANPTAKDSCISSVLVYNDHSAAVLVTLSIVDDNSGATKAATAADVFFCQSIESKDSVLLSGGDLRIWLNDTNDSFQACAAIGGVVNVFAYGIVLDDQE